jgi:hypothetical protein
VTLAAAHYDKFKEQIVAEGVVFTFVESYEYLVLQVDGHEVIPFWSSRSRMEKVQAEHPKYRGFDIKEMHLTEFVDWLPKLGEGGIRIGTNWSGKRLTGYDVEAKDLLAGLQYWIDKKVAGGTPP